MFTKCVVYSLVWYESRYDEGEHEPQVVHGTDQGSLPWLAAQVELKVIIIVKQSLK